MRELSLAGFVPLWRNLEAEGVTVLVTPSCDYIGAMELEGPDARLWTEDVLGHLGEGLRAWVGGLEDGTTLHLLLRVSEGDDGATAAWREGAEAEGALKSLLEARASFLAASRFSSPHLFLFFSGERTRGPLARAPLGVVLPFGSAERWAEAEHQRRVDGVRQLREQLCTRLQALGVSPRQLSVDEVRALHWELLNPSRRRQGIPPPAVTVRDDLFMARRHSPHLREYTEAEQLVSEDVVEEDGHLFQEDVFRRVLTLKVLPEGGTSYFATEGLLSLNAEGGERESFTYTLAVTLHVEPQARTRFLLSAQHGLVDALRHALPFLQGDSAQKRALDEAKQRSIHALFEELAEMSSKLVTVSVSLLLDASSLKALDGATDLARQVFARAGNSELLAEGAGQLPAFLAMLPGAGPWQLRKKACTSRNAADFLPVFLPWRGSPTPTSVLHTPTGEAFALDLFDRTLSTAHHGLVVADTGSGKSMALGALTLDALSHGTEAILVDNGGSWRRMTELLGGIHLPIDIRTPLCPFPPYAEVVDGAGAPDADILDDLVRFLEVCTLEPGEPGFDTPTHALLARALRQLYRERFAKEPTARPLLSDVKATVLAEKESAAHPDDRAALASVARRLSAFCGDELYGAFLDRPSPLRFDAQLLTFDLKDVSRNPRMRRIALATLMRVVLARTKARRRRTLVEVDEGHEFLGDDDAAERFWASCYRTMRKYDVAMWMVSQRLSDFLRCKAGPALLGNSKLKLLLRHDSGHAEVSDALGLSARARRAFEGLSLKPGHHADLLLLQGNRQAQLRLKLDALSYWLLTSDPVDLRARAALEARSSGAEPLSILKTLAKQFPHGVRHSGSNPPLRSPESPMR